MKNSNTNSNQYYQYYQRNGGNAYNPYMNQQQNYGYYNQGPIQCNGWNSPPTSNMNNSFSNAYPNEAPRAITQPKAQQNFNNSINYGNYHQQYSFNNFQENSFHRQNPLNNSVSYSPNLNNSYDYSFASETGFNGGIPQVGRFGGKKKKNRDLLDTSSISNTESKKSNGPKVKQPTVKQQSSNEFYFPTHTETTTHVQCPFNSEHIIQPDRLLTHINKCKLKSPNAKYFEVCPYDPCHYYSKTEIEAHILVCDKRSSFVVEDIDPSTVLNTSTTSSIPQSSENELLETSNKAPSSKLTNSAKNQYEEYILTDV